MGRGQRVWEGMGWGDGKMMKRARLLTVTIGTTFLACASGAPKRTPAAPTAPNSTAQSPTGPSETAPSPSTPGPSPNRPGDGLAELLIGGCGVSAPELRPKYVLPFAPGDRYTLTQGNCGTASHGGRFTYAFDFEMPTGTPVIAARDGVVYSVQDDRPDGSGTVGDENFVIVAHEDGEYSRYIHLTTDGALVGKGQSVARGDTIALSGHSGRSAFPHLHFDVSEACRSGPCRTVPSAFLNAEPPIPTERRAYPAGSDPTR